MARGKETKGTKKLPLNPQEAKERVLTKGTSSATAAVSEALVIKDEDVFFLCEPDGSVPLSAGHGLGLYYHDCRFLSGYEFTIADKKFNALGADSSEGYRVMLQLGNPDLRDCNGRAVHKEKIGVHWERTLSDAKLCLEDQMVFQNFTKHSIEFAVRLIFRAEFEDIFAIRGMLQQRLGKLHAPDWKDGCLQFVYDGADSRRRTTRIHFSQSFTRTGKTGVEFHVGLKPHGCSKLQIDISIAEEEENKSKRHPSSRPNLHQIRKLASGEQQKWDRRCASFDSDSLVLNRIVQRSLHDLRLLRTELDDHEFYAAGTPWFATLFGRDSLIAGLESLAFETGVTRQMLRLLAKYQGDRHDQWRDEEPGKILHELRVGEMARSGEVPHTPYYGTVDATLLFIILIGRYVDWTGDIELFRELKGNVERGLDWMRHEGDADGDGYIEYKSASDHGLVNQGWKDSGDAIVNANGDLAQPPIALVEVQAYAFLARQVAAKLFEHEGETQRAEELRREAGKLQQKFNRDFWLSDKKFYALALQRNKRAVAVISSNPGHALWSGIVPPQRAKQIVARLMQSDMFNGWGVRTLSSAERGYNPMGYHLGTIWPHDNALIAAGFRNYGLTDAMQKIFSGLVEAAMFFKEYRLPELFSGFSRAEFSEPVCYPVACHPQAWAAASILFLIQTMLGLQPAALEGRLRILNPLLPDFLDRLEICGLKVGKAVADLRFERGKKDCVDVKLLRKKGDLQIEIKKSRKRPSAQAFRESA